MLLPSPIHATLTPSSAPRRSRIVSRSATIWQGCSRSVSAFTTGTLAAPTMRIIRSAPKVRNTIAWANRDSTRAVSSIGSPRPSWVPSLVRIVRGRPARAPPPRS
jgi:hypothetical protein